MQLSDIKITFNKQGFYFTLEPIPSYDENTETTYDVKNTITEKLIYINDFKNEILFEKHKKPIEDFCEKINAFIKLKEPSLDDVSECLKNLNKKYINIQFRLYSELKSPVDILLSTFEFYTDHYTYELYDKAEPAALSLARAYTSIGEKKINQKQKDSDGSPNKKTDYTALKNYINLNKEDVDKVFTFNLENNAYNLGTLSNIVNPQFPQTLTTTMLGAVLSQMKDDVSDDMINLVKDKISNHHVILNQMCYNRSDCRNYSALKLALLNNHTEAVNWIMSHEQTDLPTQLKQFQIKDFRDLVNQLNDDNIEKLVGYINTKYPKYWKDLYKDGVKNEQKRLIEISVNNMSTEDKKDTDLSYTKIKDGYERILIPSFNYLLKMGRPDLADLVLEKNAEPKSDINKFPANPVYCAIKSNDLATVKYIYNKLGHDEFEKQLHKKCIYNILSIIRKMNRKKGATEAEISDKIAGYAESGIDACIGSDISKFIYEKFPGALNEVTNKKQAMQKIHDQAYYTQNNKSLAEVNKDNLNHLIECAKKFNIDLVGDAIKNEQPNWAKTLMKNGVREHFFNFQFDAINKCDDALKNLYDKKHPIKAFFRKISDKRPTQNAASADKVAKSTSKHENTVKDPKGQYQQNKKKEVRFGSTHHEPQARENAKHLETHLKSAMKGQKNNTEKENKKNKFIGP